MLLPWPGGMYGGIVPIDATARALPCGTCPTGFCTRRTNPGMRRIGFQLSPLKLMKCQRHRPIAARSILSRMDDCHSTQVL